MNTPIRHAVAGAFAALSLALTVEPAGAQSSPPAAEQPAPDKAKASYLIGVQFAEQLTRAGVAPDLAPDAVLKGVKDGLAGKRLEPQDQATIRQFATVAMKAAVDRNYAAANAFLATNAKASGVTTTESGLEYRVLKDGDAGAASPEPADEVTVNYRGTLLDGSEFDSSYARNKPATFHVNGVIKGWQEILPLMKPGAKWQVWVPPALAYDNVPKPGIPAASLLVFEVELLSVRKAGTPPAPAP